MVLSQSLGYLWSKHTRDDFAAMLNLLYVTWSGIDQSDIFCQWNKDRTQKPQDRRTRALVSVPCIPAIRFSNGERSTFKFVKDQWNVSHDSLIHACSLSASYQEKCFFYQIIIILIFFACALRHCRVMTGYYVTLKYQAKLRTIAWKVFATLKCLDSTWFCLANMDFRHLFHWENYISKKPPELNAIEANCALKINIFRYFAFFLELTFYFYSLYFFFVHDFFRYARAYRLYR